MHTPPPSKPRLGALMRGAGLGLVAAGAVGVAREVGLLPLSQLETAVAAAIGAGLAGFWLGHRQPDRTHGQEQRAKDDERHTAGLVPPRIRIPAGCIEPHTILSVLALEAPGSGLGGETLTCLGIDVQVPRLAPEGEGDGVEIRAMNREAAALDLAHLLFGPGEPHLIGSGQRSGIGKQRPEGEEVLLAAKPRDPNQDDLGHGAPLPPSTKEV